MKTNRILTAIMCVLMLGGVAYLLFGPPHYWDSVAPNTEKTANKLADESLDVLAEKEKVNIIKIDFNIHAPYTGTGYIDSGKYAAIYISGDAETNKRDKTAHMDLEAMFMPDGYNTEETVQNKKCSVDLRIDGKVLYIDRTVDGIQEKLSYDDEGLVRGIEKLFFNGSVDLFKTQSTQYNKYRDSSSEERYHVIRDVDMGDRFGDLCNAFDIKDSEKYNSVSLIVSVVEGVPTEMNVFVRGTEKQSYYAKTAEFLIGGFSFEMEQYELEWRLFFSL